MKQPDKSYAWYLDYAPYDRGKCELQIKKDDEQRN